jgi:hypothetical protein
VGLPDVGVPVFDAVRHVRYGVGDGAEHGTRPGFQPSPELVAFGCVNPSPVRLDYLVRCTSRLMAAGHVFAYRKSRQSPVTQHQM